MLIGEGKGYIKWYQCENLLSEKYGLLGCDTITPATVNLLSNLPQVEKNSTVSCPN
jgi:hypothetical protein